MNIRGMGDVKDTNKDKDSSKRKETYIGGESSGLAVEDNSKIESKIVSKAKQSSNSRPSNQSNGNESKIKITLYMNGFVLSTDETFRPYTEPHNQEFLKDILEERVPAELRDRLNGDVEISLEDRRSEEYVIKAPPRDPFQGEAISIGQTVVKAHPANEVDQGTEFDILIEGLPVFQINLRFPDGLKKTLRVNKCTKFAKIRETVQRISKSKNIKISKVFPCASIEADDKTVEELDIFDSTLNVTFI